MWHLPHISLRLASAIAVLALIPAWKSGSILNSTSQAQGSASVSASSSDPSHSKVDPAAAARLSSEYGKLPISFEVNQGQTDRAVQFLARGSGYTLFLSSGEAVLSLHASPHFNSGKPGNIPVSRIHPSTSTASASTTQSSAVRLQLIGSNAKAEATGVDPLPGKSNYFVGNDPAKWHTDVPTYAKVRYSNVYPGIDLLYYGNQEGRLEHDFIVAPGADPNAITVGVVNREGAVPDQNGGLTLHTQSGDLTLRSPTVYQDIDGQRKTIPATYLLANNQIKFQLGRYDRTAPLVIDPVLKYSGTFGGSGADYGEAIAVDTAGNAYVAGWTQSPTDFPLVTPLQGPSPSDNGAWAFVSKVNAAGSALMYSTYLGSASMAFGIAVDEAGRAYVTGFSGPGLPVKNAYQANPSNSDENPFLTVLSPAGNSLIYSTYLSGASNGVSYAVALDTSDNAYITGFCGGGFPTLHSIQAQGAVFVAKFSKTGGLQYSSVFATQDTETSTDAIAVDALGSAYVTGSTNSLNFPVRKPAIQSVCPERT
jgi:hypothetical protein